ncbi:LOW QUALITY PROTEIN: protein naked cuticle homolog 2 [Neofelis nebulosa]|uniref:LOW QUALITY PROTEIN: protein naked cuticle homolog 2 n=1 Tax=Neofelis nebulosa TaxID=61452 RepID=UPI002729F216|nr:LOW QUALITY PROTEIN: protein naked cuticle homolog 2 [Neofelis nebulosa]
MDKIWKGRSQIWKPCHCERKNQKLSAPPAGSPPASPGALVSGSGVLSGAPGPQHACRNHQAREAAVSHLKLFSCGNREAHFKAARGDPDRLAGGSPRGHTPPDGGSPPSCLPLVKTEYGGNATPGSRGTCGRTRPQTPNRLGFLAEPEREAPTARSARRASALHPSASPPGPANPYLPCHSTIFHHTELLSGDRQEGPFWEDQCPLEVAVTPEKAEGRGSTGQLFGVLDGEKAASREGPRGPRGLGKRHLNIDVLQCDVSVKEDNRQEWTFTFYGFDNNGKATREDVSSLMHTICEAVDASVSHSSGSSRTLRVKLTVSPESSSKRKESPPPGQDREPTHCRTEGELSEDPRGADKRLSAHVRRPGADPHPCCARGPCRVDENTERRNHYLDLAGIENYTSKFGPGSPPAPAKQEHQGKAVHPQSRSHSQEADAHDAHHRRSQPLADDHPPPAADPARALDAQPRLKGQDKQPLRSPKGSGRPPGPPGGGKPGRAFGSHLPAAPAPAPQDGQRPPQPPPQPYGHKRYRQRGREGHSPPEAVLEHGEGYAVPAVQRHEHHPS